jgi:periplasmic protein TonB
VTALAASPLDAAPHSDIRPRAAAAFGAAVLHATLFGLANALEPPHVFPIRPPAVVTQVEIELVAKAIAPEKPIATVPVDPARSRPAPRRTRQAPRPVPAEPAPAAAALTAIDANAPTSNTLVSGSAEATAREPVAIVAHAQTSARPTREVSEVSGVSDGPDRSRAPQLSGAAEWRCPFPIEADGADIDRAVVTLRVEVAPDGSVIRTAALDDPGHGFSRQAQRCALRKRWAPGLDRAGKPAPATAIVRVRFER